MRTEQLDCCPDQPDEQTRVEAHMHALICETTSHDDEAAAFWSRLAPELPPEYEASVGPILKLLQSLEGRSEGDPRKIADVIVQLANSGAGFLSVGDIFAQVINGDAQTRLVDRVADPKCIFHLSTGYKTAGEALPDGGSLGQPAQRATL